MLDQGFMVKHLSHTVNGSMTWWSLLYDNLLFVYPLSGSEPFHWQAPHLLKTNHVYWNRVAANCQRQIVGIQCHILLKQFWGPRCGWFEVFSPDETNPTGWLSHPTGWLRVGGVIGSQIWEFQIVAKVWMIPTHLATVVGFSFKTAFTNSLYTVDRIHTAAPFCRIQLH